MLVVGRFISTYFNEYPITDEPKPSAWDILTGKAPSSFHTDETYIYYLFHYIHSCVYIDVNPSKTVAAIIIMLAIMPLILFSILNYQRVQLQEGPEWEGHKSWSKTSMVIEVICFTYFPMCLVNTPIEDQDLFNTRRAKLQFCLHYIPYFMLKLALIVLSLNQVYFLTIKDKKPFRFMTKGFLRAYFKVMIVLYIVYAVFIFSHIINGPGKGLWDAITPLGQLSANTVSYGFLTMTVLIPAICALVDAENVKSMTIEFSMQ